MGRRKAGPGERRDVLRHRREPDRATPQLTGVVATATDALGFLPAHVRARARVLTVVAMGSACTAALAQPASAHGIGGQAASKSPVEFVPIGIEHMLLGWDHLLFIVAVVLLAGTLRRAAKLITVFVVGRSATLIAATMADWLWIPGGWTW